MWTVLTYFLGSIFVVIAESSLDVPLKNTISSDSIAETLRRMEERQIGLVAKLETMRYAADRQLAQLNDNILKLNRELGGSRTNDTLSELRQTADTSTQEEQSLLALLRQELSETKRQLQAQLNNSHDRLAMLLEGSRMFAADSRSAQTTVIVEKCSYRDQFQTADQWRPADCAAVQQRQRRSGVYTIYPTSCGNGGGLRVFCDMDTDGGGWTVLMRRADLPVHQDFNMGWESYKWGFGNLSGEFWLGNEYMNLISSTDQMHLRIDLHSWKNESRTALYTPFSVGSEQQKYVLKIGKYSGNAGDALKSLSNNMKFTTKDADNDSWSRNCAVAYQNAWWHKACMHSTLTGPYKPETMKANWIGVTWRPWKGARYSLKHVEMKMRPVNYMTYCHKLAQEGAKE